MAPAEVEIEIEIEPIGQEPDAFGVDPAPQPDQEPDDVSGGHPWVLRQLARKVANPALDREAVAMCVEPQQRRRALGGPDEVHQESDRGRFAGAIRTDESEDFPPVDLEVEVEQPARFPVIPGQAGAGNRGAAGLGGGNLSCPEPRTGAA